MNAEIRSRERADAAREGGTSAGEILERATRTRRQACRTCSQRADVVIGGAAFCSTHAPRPVNRTTTKPTRPAPAVASEAAGIVRSLPCALCCRDSKHMHVRGVHGVCPACVLDLGEERAFDLAARKTFQVWQTGR